MARAPVDVDFNVGDQVRVVVNRKAFDNGYAPKWSKTLPTISKAGSGYSFYLDEKEDKPYKYYELQKIKSVQTHPSAETPIKNSAPAPLSQSQKEVRREAKELGGVRLNKWRVFSHVEIPERKRK